MKKSRFTTRILDNSFNLLGDQRPVENSSMARNCDQCKVKYSFKIKKHVSGNDKSRKTFRL